MVRCLRVRWRWRARSVSSGLTAHADQDKEDKGKRIKRVFVIAMENHNWTQPS